jgi:hypothetical protein
MLITRSFLRWLKVRTHSVGKIIIRKPLFSLGLALILVLASVLVHTAIIHALSKEWVQTDWSGGEDPSAASDPDNLTGWDNYISGTNIDHSTAGEVKLQRTFTQP